MDARKAFAGATLMGACACGLSNGLSKAAGAIGWAVSAPIIHWTLLGLGGALFYSGLCREKEARVLGALGLLALGSGFYLAPAGCTHGPTGIVSQHLIGFGLYFVAAGLLVWTALRVYRPRPLWPATMALGGMGLAAGCGCCLVQEGLKAMLTSVGAPAWMMSRPFTLGLAVAVAASGLLGARRAGALLPLLAGVAVVYPLNDLARNLLPPLTVGNLNLTFLVRYPFWGIGIGLMLYATTRTLVPQVVQAKVPQSGTLPYLATSSSS